MEASAMGSALRRCRFWGPGPQAWPPLLLALAMLCWVSAARAAALEENGVRVVVELPRPGQVVRARVDSAPLAGVAHAGNRPTAFDVIVVIDVSGSTAYPSLMDVNRNGQVGMRADAMVRGLPSIKNTDPGDSILAAEVAAGSALLEGLDPQRVRVGVVSFSGAYRPDGKRQNLGQASVTDATLEQVLTDDYALVRERLAAVLARGAQGGTNLEAGIKMALRELAGLDGARSRPNPRARKVVLVLTDGKPSLPFGKANEEDEGDVEAAIMAAELASHAKVQINVYGLGEFAIDYPFAATEVARVTGGVYTPVRRPGDIVTLLSGVSFANVEEVVAVNLTMGEMAGPNDIELRPDGSFRGFVPVRPGVNRVRVSALASDGTRGSAEIEIEFRHEELTDAELASERNRIQQRNRDLQLLMEKRNQQSFREQERDRMLELEIEDEQSDEEKP